ncbi:MAG TPA: 4Fe-4S dicluster domain-containing protein [Firmicutes bacterium]|nr:4Fe-4S dicluster domain-containing protein [Bacillota bacterium]
MAEKYKILFVAENCIQCHACEVACKSWRELEPGVRLRRIIPGWEGEYPAVKQISISAACIHCEEPPCAEACPVEAIIRDAESGLVLVNRKVCTGCRLCLEACPCDAPQFGEDETMKICDLCYGRVDLQSNAPPCVATCPTGALILQKKE